MGDFLALLTTKNTVSETERVARIRVAADELSIEINGELNTMQCGSFMIVWDNARSHTVHVDSDLIASEDLKMLFDKLSKESQERVWEACLRLLTD